jgi:biopolymer transport protein ExbD
MDVGSSKGPRSEINVTPLIDVVLVLLIIFMVLTPSMLKHLTATVPKKSDEVSASPMPDQSTIVVEYTAKRELTVNGESVAPEGLAAKLSERLRASRKKAVFFRAEDEAMYGEVVRLLDFARGAGAESLAIITDKM